MEAKKDISVKSTKNEILQAYNELLTKIKEEKPFDRKEERKKEEEKKIIKGASQNSVEKIVKGLAEIKLEIGTALDTLEERLIKEFKKLTELQQAIEIEQKELEEIHEIKVNADSLAALLRAQKEKRSEFDMEMEEKKGAFETEMAQKRLEWKKEQEDYDLSRKERDMKVKKEREREEEEYSYALQLKRKKDNDVYEAKKAALEKELKDKRANVERELSEREALVSARENELSDLKAQVAEFPKQLEKAIKDTEKSVIERLEFKYKHEAQLATKEIEGERKLNKQVVAALEAKIKEQDAHIRQLTQKTDQAGQQVQDIAIKAIEGASSQRVFSKNYETPKEGIALKDQ
jgi:hypothetical protein